MSKRFPVLVLLSVSLGLRAVGALEAAHTLFVPVVAHLPATGGTNWASDLRLYNPTQADASAGLTFLPAGADNSSAPEVSVTIKSGENLLLEDVVTKTFGEQSYGAIRIQSSASLIASASTYLATPNPFPGTSVPRKETFQSPAVDETEWSSSAPRFLFVANRFRDVEAGMSVRDSSTNVGLLNPSPDAVFIVLTLLDQDQSVLLGGITIPLPPYGFTQIVDLFAALSASDVRTENAILSIGAILSALSPSLPAPVLAYAVRQTATYDDCGGFEKQADFLFAQRAP